MPERDSLSSFMRAPSTVILRPEASQALRYSTAVSALGGAVSASFSSRWKLAQAASNFFAEFVTSISLKVFSDDDSPVLELGLKVGRTRAVRESVEPAVFMT